MVAVTLPHPFKGDHALTAARGLGEGKGNRRLLGLRRLDPLHPGQLLDAVLGLGRLAGFRPEAVDEALEFLDLPLLVAVGGPLLFVPGRLLLQVGVVVAAVAVELPVADLEDRVADGIEERSVVGDGQNRPPVGTQVLLEPSEGLEVEMVRRLIEHQEIGLHDQQSRQMRPHDPTAAEGPGRAVGIPVAEGESREDPSGLDLERMPVEFGEPPRRLVMGLLLLGVLSQRPLDDCHFGRDVHRQFQNGLVPGRGALLREEADRHGSLGPDGARVRGGFAEDQGKEGGLSGSVCTDESDPVSPVDLERGILEEGASSVGFAERGGGEHGGGRQDDGQVAIRGEAENRASGRSGDPGMGNPTFPVRRS